MRILLVVGALPPEPHAVAADPHVRLAEALAARGHSVQLLAPALSGSAAPVPPENVNLETVPVSAGARLLAPLRVVRALSAAVGRSCARGGVNVVHAFGWRAATAAAYADRHGRRLAVTVQAADVALARRIPGGRLAFGAVLKRAAAASAEFGWVAAQVERMRGPNSGPVPLTPVALLGYVAARPPEGVQHGIVYVGELVQSEGLGVLLDALSLLRKRGLPLDLTVVGDGRDRGELRARALALGVPAVFAGFVPADQVRDHVAGKRVLVVPSLAPGSPGAVPEALRYGVPVVATRGGAADDLVPPEAGLLVPTGDPAALADAIKTVATDDEFLAGAYHAGTLLGVHASPAKLAEQCEGLYASVRGRSSGLHSPSGVFPRQSDRANRIP